MNEDIVPLFETKEDYKKWIESQSWYQTIELENGLSTPGKFPTHKRLPILKAINFAGKSVLDIGCNSGQYSLYAKAHGASSVLGIDVDDTRLSQARVISKNEKLDVSFLNKSIFDLNEGERFDIVLCIAVLTEISDLYGAVEKLKGVIGDYALLELDIAKPLLYLSASKNWFLGYRSPNRRTGLSEMRKLKDGRWVFSPSLGVLKGMFGNEFVLSNKQGGARYDMVEVRRVK